VRPIRVEERFKVAELDSKEMAMIDAIEFRKRYVDLMSFWKVDV
jgi:hypothetical protein